MGDYANRLRDRLNGTTNTPVPTRFSSSLYSEYREPVKPVIDAPVDAYIIRIEHQDSGKGLFTHRFEDHQTDRKRFESLCYMKEPTDFPIGKKVWCYGTHRSAFNTPLQMFNNIKFAQSLTKLGFDVVILKCTKAYLLPDGQSFYDPQYAEEVERTDFLSIYDRIDDGSLDAYWPDMWKRGA